ncbi:MULTISPECIES: phospho-N-acetylmuramoyl-pentapeptide-transferase [Acidobacterium]|uniref:Phospho-N-acetylmuramoyl-pentapeptide-transferase n=1 Tax=Acidobacterium capsulatum (strain ATCC 51196 / DSM 11244 / BCRC 80197 / JCM 7670 / NBRC 15755 / NCIMB 13165 / 161) TaxID=240015 RepID=MRAY_ACIC5|nr:MULTISPECIES: phospho-N-acetylmuramoyl-pentapeptide-transferase [Acidobacterium]C1F461.1 RecName: Full=Phospho-N-acetylmuramoyl-pentapeptide-transferase; AltName: Full=UDP-MurNAc-pentapeptide phosphotransferase [Acidobacterium capsulatum ATCC 51196]ACO32749.1 phospho-N-acetylmuramoyl-pentapeptide-transferase [Acidobacterium capsulatum ATCC 51196]HCT60317.1 phospho-N-acetylmuramoyl-pentapeptide-transferase [Acidobacterium sp.]
MLYWLLYQKLFPYFRPFRIFRYLTFRTAFASLTALLIALLIGPYVIEKLREFQIGQYIREEGPQAHQKKAGTPTMGGVLICIAILLPTLLWSDLSDPFVWIVMLSTLAFGAIGFADDYIKVVHRRNLGLTARAKMTYQILASAAIGVALVVLQGQGSYSTDLMVPFAKSLRPRFSIPALLHVPHLAYFAFIPFVIFVIIVIVGSSNAVNLTDGLDGLAIGCTIIAAGALTVLTYVSGHAVFADYLELQRMPMVGEVTIFCGAMVGASIGFLWYNAHPAQIFMGDVGSLALGGAIATVAVVIKQELLLPFIGGIFVLEALSVILQVGSYKLRKKRIFKMAPLHHHFELIGWSESKVIVRFWIAALVFALFALTTLKLR